MNFFGLSVLTLAVLANAEDGKAKEKRGVADYSSQSAGPSQYSTASGPLYTKSLQALLQKSGPSLHQEYVSHQPAAAGISQAQQYHQQAEPQAVAYAQPAVTKYASAPAAVQKFAYAAQPQIQYSSAADVSSFSYSSPVVAYNNQGLLHQIAGKTAGSNHGSPVTYNASPASRVQYQPSPKYQYVTASSGYSAAPNAYSQGSNGYEDASNAYQQVSQKALFSSAPEQPQAVTYQSSPVSQKVSYVQSPAPAVYQIPKAGQVSYAPAPSAQHYSPQQYSPQQYSAQQYSAPQHSAQGSQASSGYETAAQSAPQAFFSRHVPQSQLFQIAPQFKPDRYGTAYSN